MITLVELVQLVGRPLLKATGVFALAGVMVFGNWAMKHEKQSFTQFAVAEKQREADAKEIERVATEGKAANAEVIRRLERIEDKLDRLIEKGR